MEQFLRDLRFGGKPLFDDDKKLAFCLALCRMCPISLQDAEDKLKSQGLLKTTIRQRLKRIDCQCIFKEENGIIVINPVWLAEETSFDKGPHTN